MATYLLLQACLQVASSESALLVVQGPSTPSEFPAFLQGPALSA